MGNYLEVPITEKHSCDGGSEYLMYGVSSMQVSLHL